MDNHLGTRISTKDNEGFNYTYFFITLGVLLLSFLIMWTIVRESSSDPSTRGNALSAEDRETVEDLAASFLNTAGNFGVVDNIDLSGENFDRYLELAASGDLGDLIETRDEVYEKLAIPGGSPLQKTGSLNISSEETLFTSFRLKDLKLGIPKTRVVGDDLLAIIPVSYLSTETYRSTQTVDKTRTISRVQNTVPVSGELTFKLYGDQWKIYDLSLDYPYTLANWSFSPEFSEIRQKGNVVDSITTVLDESG